MMNASGILEIEKIRILCVCERDSSSIYFTDSTKKSFILG